MIEVGSWKERMGGFVIYLQRESIGKLATVLAAGWFSLQGHEIEDLYTQKLTRSFKSLVALGMTVQISIITSPRSSPTPLFLATIGSNSPSCLVPRSSHIQAGHELAVPFAKLLRLKVRPEISSDGCLYNQLSVFDESPRLRG